MQMDRLVHAYLDYRSRDAGEGMPTPGAAHDASGASGDYPVLDNIELVDIFCAIFYYSF